MHWRGGYNEGCRDYCLRINDAIKTAELTSIYMERRTIRSWWIEGVMACQWIAVWASRGAYFQAYREAIAKVEEMAVERRVMRWWLARCLTPEDVLRWFRGWSNPDGALYCSVVVVAWTGSARRAIRNRQRKRRRVIREKARLKLLAKKSVCVLEARCKPSMRWSFSGEELIELLTCRCASAKGPLIELTLETTEDTSNGQCACCTARLIFFHSQMAKF